MTEFRHLICAPEWWVLPHHRFKGPWGGDEHRGHVQLSACPPLYLYLYLWIRWSLDGRNCNSVYPKYVRRSYLFALFSELPIDDERKMRKDVQVYHDTGKSWRMLRKGGQRKEKLEGYMMFFAARTKNLFEWPPFPFLLRRKGMRVEEVPVYGQICRPRKWLV